MASRLITRLCASSLAHLILVACVLSGAAVAMAWAADAHAAVCAPVTARYEFGEGGSYLTYAQKLRTRDVTCVAARRLLSQCGKSTYAPIGWIGADLRRRDRDGRNLFDLRSRGRHIYFRAANDSILPCASSAYPRRVSGVSREPLNLTSGSVGGLRIGMRLDTAERASGLDLRRFGLACARSFARDGVAVVLTDDTPAGTVRLLLVTDRRVPTAAGLRVGDSVDQMKHIYGSAAVQVSDPQASNQAFAIPGERPDEEYGVSVVDGTVSLLVGGARGDTAADEYCA